MLRPRIRPGTYFVPTSDGVYFFTPERTEVFTGKSIHAWVERLAPHLDGRKDFPGLLETLSPERRDLAEKIVAALAERGLVRDAADDLPHTLTDADLDAYAAQIAHLDELVGSGANRFERWRRCRTVAIGSGRTFAALVAMLNESGVAALTVHDLDAASEEVLATLCAGADLVVHMADHPDPERASALDETCRALGIPLVQGIVLGDEAWLGPVGGAAPGGQSWEATWRRLEARQDSETPSVPGRYVTGAAAKLAGAMVGLVAFRHVTGVESRSGRLTRIDLATLTTSDHTVVAEPDYAVIDDEGFDTRVPAVIDPRVGLLGEVSERSLPQLPLNTAVATVHPPRQAAIEVVGAGPGFRAARLAAAKTGLEHYAWLSTRPGPVPSTLASGYDLESAKRVALTALCQEITVRAPRTVPCPRVVIDPGFLTGPAALSWKLLQTARIETSVFDVTGRLGVPVFAFCRGDRTVAYAAGLAEGFEAVLLDDQLRTHPHHLPAPVPQLPAHLRGSRPSVPSVREFTSTELVERLSAAGSPANTEVLETDPAVGALLPYLVHATVIEG